MESKEKSNKYSIFVLGCLIGAITFIGIYGIKVLDVTYDSWLMNGGDLSQHYIGWKFFRESQWNFPFGLIDGIIYPNKVSIMYMDSIPIFALIFKILSPLLPTTFQYFGIWGIISFMLQGGLASLIIRKFTSSYLICLGSALIFIFSPILIMRMYAHTALAGHWIILLGIYVYINKSYIDSLKKNIIIWSFLACVSVTVHMYFLPMIIVIMSCYLLRDYLENKDVLRVLVIFFCTIVAALSTLFLLGAFWGSSDLQGGGLGSYSANINALFNPQGYSKYLMNLSTATTGQYEGFAYLGLGVIIALIVTIYFEIDNLLKIRNKKISIYIKNNLNKCILSIGIVIFFILALSPQVTFNSHILFTIPYPKIITNILGIFRASGRFIWPICYILTIYIIRKIINRSTKKQAIIFLGICIFIQISDLSNIIIQKNNYFSNKVEYTSDFKSPIWDELAKKNYKHIDLMKNVMSNNSLIYSLSNYAINSNMTLNDGYIARRDSKSIDAAKNQYLKELQQGISREDVIYILGSTETESGLFSINYPINYPLNYYKIDGLIIGVKEEISNIEEYKEKIIENLKLGINILPKNNQYLIQGKDSNKGRILNSQGISHGPYMAIENGSYTVSITGDNLNKVNYDACYNEGQKNVELQEIERNNQKIVFKFKLEDDLTDLECRVFNKSEEDIVLNSILISK